MRERAREVRHRCEPDPWDSRQVVYYSTRLLSEWFLCCSVDGLYQCSSLVFQSRLWCGSIIDTRKNGCISIVYYVSSSYIILLLVLLLLLLLLLLLVVGISILSPMVGSFVAVRSIGSLDAGCGHAQP